MKKLNSLLKTALFAATVLALGSGCSLNLDEDLSSSFYEETVELENDDRSVSSSETITFSSLGYSSNTTLSTVSGTSCSLTFSKGSGSASPIYYKKNSDVRFYKGNTLKVSSGSTISSIVFTYKTAPSSGVITANCGTYSYSSKTWSGSSTSVTFTNSASSGNVEIVSMKISYSSSSSGSSSGSSSSDSSSSSSSGSSSTSTGAYAKLGTLGYLNSSSYIDSSYTNKTYSENTALLLGNPSKATANSSYKRNYLVEKTQFAISYNDVNHISNWVAWHLCSSDIGSTTRYSGNFQTDSDLPSSFYKVLHSDYSNSGFDRGHMCPSGDRTSSTANNKATFVTSNIVPQTANNNQLVWNYLEEYERTLAQNGKELYIYAGSYGQGGQNSSGTSKNYISWPSSNSSAPSDSGILVPAYTWKIILVIDEGTGDLSRISSSTASVIAVNIPNKTTCYSNATSTYSGSSCWKYYLTTVDSIEALTGYDFFTNLSSSVETALESKKYSD